MAIKTYIGDSEGVAREIKKLYYGDENGIARELSGLYSGDTSGTARRIFNSTPRFTDWVKANFISAAPSNPMKYTQPIFDGEKFVSMNTYAATSYPNTSIQGIYSFDGILWEKANSLTIVQNPYNVHLIYENGLFIAINSPYQSISVKAFAYSTDGIRWYAGSFPKSFPYNPPTYGNGFWAITPYARVTSNIKGSLYSNDGIKWEESSNDLPDKGVVYWKKAISVGNRFIALANTSRPYIAISETGRIWSTINIFSSSSSGRNWQTVCDGNNVLVLVDFDGSCYYSQDDGSTWKYSERPAGGYAGIRFGNERFVLISNSSSYGIRTAASQDGKTWEKSSIPGFSYTQNFKYVNGKFCVLIYTDAKYENGTSKIACSENGVDWTISDLPAVATWNEVAGGEKEYVITATNSNISACSKDGIHWIPLSMPSKADWTTAVYGNRRFVSISGKDETAAYRDES